MGKYVVTFRPKHPKCDQNLQFALLSETKNIPVTFIREENDFAREMENIIICLRTDVSYSPRRT